MNINKLAVKYSEQKLESKNLNGMNIFTNSAIFLPLTRTIKLLFIL